MSTSPWGDEAFLLAAWVSHAVVTTYLTKNEAQIKLFKPVITQTTIPLPGTVSG